MDRIKGLIALAAAATLAACASQGPPAPTASSASATSSANATSSASATSSANATSPASATSFANATNPASAPPASAAQQADTKLALPYGYKPAVRNGRQVYCRTDFDTGSRVHKETTCLTAAQLEKQQENAQSYIQQVQKNGGTGISFNTPGGPGSAPMGH